MEASTVIGLERVYRSLFDAAVEAGAVFPIRVASIAANGSVICVELTPEPGGAGVLSCRTLAESYQDGFRFPINVMVVDDKGDSRTALVATADEIEGDAR